VRDVPGGCADDAAFASCVSKAASYRATKRNENESVIGNWWPEITWQAKSSVSAQMQATYESKVTSFQ
jgi:hypothetical protein